MNKKKNTFVGYLRNLKKSIKINREIINKLENFKKKIINCKKNNKKVIIFGNGGSSAVASHFALDLTNVCDIRCVNFSNSELITCFSNDYGFENWIYKALNVYADDGDMLVLISSSGMSKNMINGIKKTRIKFSDIVTFTGFNNNNTLKTLGDLSFYVKSNVYNIVENIHQIWLLSLVDIMSFDKKS
jgi:D-sedoheptulose 7-phosphate isomerase